MRCNCELLVCTLVLLLTVGAMLWLPPRLPLHALPLLLFVGVGLLGLYYFRHGRLP